VRHIQLKDYEQMLKVSWRTNTLAYLSGVSVEIFFGIGTGKEGAAHPSVRLIQVEEFSRILEMMS
jgi:hypothetical protein